MNSLSLSFLSVIHLIQNNCNQTQHVISFTPHRSSLSTLPRQSSWCQREAVWQDRRGKKRSHNQTGTWWTLSCRLCHADNAGALLSEQKGCATHLLKVCFDICARLIRARLAGLGFFSPTDENTGGRQVRNIHPSHPGKQQFRIYKRSCLYTGHHRKGTTRKHKAESVSWQGKQWHISALPCHCLFLYSLEWSQPPPLKRWSSTGVVMPCGPHFRKEIKPDRSRGLILRQSQSHRHHIA